MVIDCRVVVKGLIAGQLADWFSDLHLTETAGNTLISGQLPDEAAVYGLLARIQALGLALVAINCCSNGEGN